MKKLLVLLSVFMAAEINYSKETIHKVDLDLLGKLFKSSSLDEYSIKMALGIDSEIDCFKLYLAYFFHLRKNNFLTGSDSDNHTPFFKELLQKINECKK